MEILVQNAILPFMSVFCRHIYDVEKQGGYVHRRVPGVYIHSHVPDACRLQPVAPDPHQMCRPMHPYAEIRLVDLYMGDRSVCGSLPDILRPAVRMKGNSPT